MSFQKYLREDRGATRKDYAETLSRKASLAKYLDELEPSTAELNAEEESE